MAGAARAGAGGPPAEEEMPELSDGEEAWEEEEEEEEGAEGLRTRCLFCDRLFSSAEGTFSHCKTEHQFNVCDVIKKHGLDFYGYIKLINFVRLKKPTGAYLSSLSSPLPWEREEYLKPELEDDLLLQFGCILDQRSIRYYSYTEELCFRSDSRAQYKQP